MSRFFNLDATSAALPEVRPILEALRIQRDELVQLRDDAVGLQAAIEAAGEAGATESGGAPAGRRTSRETTRAAAELRVVRLRMQGVIDQMQAGVARLDAIGVSLRDIGTGLIDFPALVNGRQVWLCWRLGEPEVGWWHELEAGVAGRRPLEELE